MRIYQISLFERIVTVILFNTFAFELNLKLIICWNFINFLLISIFKMGEVYIPVPIGGNAFITQKDLDALDEITDTGFVNWTEPTTICTVYIHLTKSGTFNLSLRILLPSTTNTGPSRLRITLVNDPTQTFDVIAEPSSEAYILPVGQFNFESPTTRFGGYVQFTFQGLEKVGPIYAEIHDALISNYTTGRLHYVGYDFSYYFGRRGPSVHLRPIYPTDRNIQYYYNEITVPTGQDIIGSYYMATGFFGGYFGFQVNSETERRILFSIWSAYESDDPEQVPEDYKVVMLRKDEDVLVQEFGDEGTGLQSILLHNWEPEQNYKFLVYGSPDPSNPEEQTIFTGWFYSPAIGEWKLMASFMRPKTSTYLTSLYAFLENFIPEQGYVDRKAFYDNQWIRSTNGVWQELTGCRFTGDATSVESRKDYAGGFDYDTGRFYLRNCGFFHDRVDTNIEFIRQPTNMPPEVDLEELP